MIFNIMLSLIGWITIIALRGLPSGDAFSQYEMAKDQNNLFGTCFVYIILDAVCKSIAIRWLQIILCAAMILFAVPPTLSSLLLCFNPLVSIRQKMVAIICSAVPLIIAVNCLLSYVIWRYL